MDNVRVFRIIEYVGPRDIVEDNIRRAIHGTKTVTCRGRQEIAIRATTLGEFPEVMNDKEGKV